MAEPRSLKLIRRLPHCPPHQGPTQILPLTAGDRTRTRHHFTVGPITLTLALPRGTGLQAGDYLEAESGEIVQITAQPEPVLTVTAPDPTTLLRAAYHLGNRHVPLEVTADHLRFSPDPVLAQMLDHLGATVTAETAPFYPEAGAYHSHDHA
ncbi:urease accessory protein UreE [Spirulina major CS-329]|uniref:urease accessory protein UreE n=1 Tax=Spirulina TaxID=1154 RepID=UPI00232B28AD|nr:MULTISPECIES: urease accessory protein UreE [Spirulina]MDB9496487.1 urease accessory protein UreE [Spirulina subsalsa CS-330]MDB9504740.1 urease accessory protein UreE [Spirulina major CS-329]